MTDGDDALTAHCKSRVGQQIGAKWTLASLIGVGGMAAVYLAKHRNGASAAIKLLHGEYAAHEELRARFLREAYIANQVDHPGAVRVLDDDVTDAGELYLVMELLRGKSVESYTANQGGRLPLMTVLAVADHTLGVLEAAHAKGIVHRDLKPDNLFLTEDRSIKILDFGIARLRDSTDRKQTQTGVVMGTPAFMAPEQALARWSEVDGRTDLFSVGAILFTLLTGRDVHEAETAGEQLVFAATRPAPSLARFVEAPLPVVQLVDRALAYEQAKRFQSAAEMRAAVQSVRQSLGATPAQPATQATSAPEVSAAPVTAPSATAPTVAAAAAPTATAAGVIPEPSGAQPTALVRRKQDQKVRLYDASFSTRENVEDMQELFSQLEKLLAAKRQYGEDHPEVARRREALFSHCASSLLRTEVALAWNITPYSFVAGDATLWEPRAPFDRIPYQLFSDGIRLLGLLPGLSEKEFFELLGIMTLDRSREMAPEDDFATLLWDACFGDVVHHAIDSFAQGDQQDRAEFERMTAEIVRLAQFDSSFQLEDCWEDHQSSKRKPIGPQQQRETLVGLLSAEQSDTEAMARAAALHQDQDLPQGTGAADALQVDPATIQVLATRIDVDTRSAGERFVVVAARAYQAQLGGGSPQAVATPLRNAVDRLAEASPEMAIALVCSLCNAIRDERTEGNAEGVRSQLAGAVVSTETMGLILTGACGSGAKQSVFAEGLERLLVYLDGTHVPVVLAAIAEITEQAIIDQLIAYLARTGRGQEQAMGEMFGEAGLELGLALVRVLATLDTPEARNAISHASTSLHPVVRIEALGYVEGVSSNRLRLELRALLEDKDEGVRLAALRAMEQHNIRVAGPFLVLRIKDGKFDKLPWEERKQALCTLATLAPTRAEPVCLELLRDERVVSSDAHEQTRAAAADTLGRVSSSQKVAQILEEISTKRWRNSERVRSASRQALQQVSARIAEFVNPSGGSA